jgi:hypothetical protein
MTDRSDRTVGRVQDATAPFKDLLRALDDHHAISENNDAKPNHAPNVLDARRAADVRQQGRSREPGS